MRHNLELYQEISDQTIQVVKDDLSYWKKKDPEPYQGDPKILFMGTGGNPVNLVEQPRQTGGFILYLPNYVLAVDPGPGAIWHARQNQVDLRQLNGIFISHGHTDHYLGAPPLIEGMTRLMSQRRGMLMIPQDVQDEHLISLYHQGRNEKHEGYSGGPERVVCLSEGEEIELASDLRLMPVKVYHSNKLNYGFVLKTSEMTIGYTSDTSYITSYEDLNGEQFQLEPKIPIPPGRVTGWREDLKEIFGQVDYLIANISYFNLFPNRHLTGVGLAHLLENSKVKRCWITHFDACCSRPDAMDEKIAQMVTESSGVDVIAAGDGRCYNVIEE